MSPKRIATLAPVCCLLLISPYLGAQNSSNRYRVTVIDGDGALNNLSTRAAREPVVQVSDARARPVAGAYVEFDAPTSGASDHFATGGSHFATTTNSDGLAIGSDVKNNGVGGSFVIQVHVSYQGQSIGETQLHQSNVAGHLSSGLQQPGLPEGSGLAPADINISPKVLGVAFGDEFLINGAVTPSNANLLNGTKIQATTKPVTLYLHDHCEYIVAPHSAATVGAKVVTLESGSVRARRFGNCRILYGGLWITGSPNADGVAALMGPKFAVASVSGTVQVVNSAGDVISSIQPGAVATFGTSSIASGAEVGGPVIPLTRRVLMGTDLAVALASVGLSADAIAQHQSTYSQAVSEMRDAMLKQRSIAPPTSP